MSIEKMSLVNIIGSLSCLNDTLMKCCQSELFHPEFTATSPSGKGFRLLNEENPFTPKLQALTDMMAIISVPQIYREYSSLDMTEEDMNAYIDATNRRFFDLINERSELQNSLTMHEQALIQVKHMDGLELKFDDILKSKYSIARFGKLPVESYMKLNYFRKKMFFFFTFDHDDDYYWGVYFAPSTNIDEIDELFASLYFEPIKIPDDAHDTPRLAAKNIAKQIEEEKKLIQKLDEDLARNSEDEKEKIQQVYTLLKMKNDTFAFRRYAVTGYDQFHLEGFVPKRHVKKFIAMFDSIPNVICEVQPEDADARLQPPVKLNTNWIFKPFELFVNMYGLPGYYDFNPTSFIGLIYCLLFGIMFGDLGQGAVLIVVGILMWKIKKMQLGQVLTRCGITSMIFGTVYGSVFGMEHLLDPLFRALGFAEKPINVFKPATTNMILIATVGIGMVVIVSSIILNIYLGLKKKDYERALFSNNGVAGLIFYLGTVTAVVLMMLGGVNPISPLFIILVIAIPLLLMFLKEPLGKLLKRRKDIKPEEGIGSFIIQNFFELFEYLLSFVSNTLSFLRVGGFILSHAGMMMVVMTLAELVGTVGSPVVMIIGNIFVMGLEGLLVGIQVMRLVFYETFSRFYESNGKPFAPAKVEFEHPAN